MSYMGWDVMRDAYGITGRRSIAETQSAAEIRREENR
jgi:hypothetical protein